MEWVLVPITLGSIVLTGLIYNSGAKELQTYLSEPLKAAYGKGTAYGIVIGAAAVLTGGMIIDTIVRLVK